MKTQLKKIACFSKGQQINGEQLLSNGKYDYLNGGIYPSGKWSDYNVEGDTIAISEGGNSCGYVNYMESNFWCGGHCYYLYDVKCSSKYLYYALKSQQDRIMKLRSGACMPNIKKKDLADFVFEYNDNSIVQKKVVLVLDTLESVILSKQLFVKKLDELIKSRFVEMFGDPIINPFNWDELVIANVLRGKASNGFFAKRDEYCDDGNVSVLGVTNIVNRMYSNCNNLPKTNANSMSIEKYSVRYGDMLFCRSSLVAEGIGKASIVPINIPDNVLFECHVIRLPLDTNKVIPEYLQVLTTLDFFRNQVLASAKTATMTTIGQDGILKCNIILPPYKMQQEYLTYISRIEKTKSAVNQSIEKLETLKKSLMQVFFMK